MTTKEPALAKITELQTPAQSKRRTAKEQALTPLLKRRDALKKRWDDADSAALRKNRDRFGPEFDELENLIAVIQGDDERGPDSE